MAHFNSNGGFDCSGRDDVLAYDRCPPALRKVLREAPNSISAFMAQRAYASNKGRYGRDEATGMVVETVDRMIGRFLDDSPRYWAGEFAKLDMVKMADGFRVFAARRSARVPA